MLPNAGDFGPDYGNFTPYLTFTQVAKGDFDGGNLQIKARSFLLSARSDSSMPRPLIANQS